MEIHQLRYFCAVAETSSFSRARRAIARFTAVIVPTNSQAGRRTRRPPVMIVWRRSVRLTELGKTFLPRARAVLRELEAPRVMSTSAKTPWRLHLYRGHSTIAPYLLPPHLTFLLANFRRPGLR